MLYIGTLNVPVLKPDGIIAVKERDLITTSSYLMLIVVVPVYILTLFVAWKYRAENVKARHAPEWEHNYVAEYCWWGIPLVIVLILSALIWKSSHELNPFKPIDGKKEMVIQAVALNWKWLFIYPEQGIATVNFVQFPEKTPINFQITADAPMNSFWIPALGGQIYAMPAMKSQLHLIASKPGSFKGNSANFSGKGFAGMTFVAESVSQENFEKWLENGKGAGGVLDVQEYERLVMPSENNPVATYSLGERDLFNYILDKYNVPPKK
ncbi:MAG TPA: ubiquinol oxidase subunit II [Rhabdochlamydiaceae bacterium]|nr:ubiquinol oxidase subunit II [Rhabdochlamydiaceae bacterium]